MTIKHLQYHFRIFQNSLKNKELEDLKKVRTRGNMWGLTLQSASKSHMSVGSPGAKGQALPWEQRCAPSLRRVQLTAETNSCNDSDSSSSSSSGL
jgi:hypothetical protein